MMVSIKLHDGTLNLIFAVATQRKLECNSCIQYLKPLENIWYKQLLLVNNF